VDASHRGDVSAFAEIVRYYDLWRKIADALGGEPYDEAEWEDGRLYFRSDYADKLREWPKWKEFGDWGAYIIAPTSEGYYNVIRSLRHERAYERSEKVEVVFSKIADAGKYIIAHIGGSLSVHLMLKRRIKLKTLATRWSETGLDPRIQVTPASERVLDYLIKVRPDTDRVFAKMHLKQYTLRDDPSAYGIAFPAEETYMQVLAMSFQELHEALLHVIPDSIKSEVSGWSD
jgi:hypothetical protein